MDDNGSTLATDQKKAEHMNRFYTSVSRAAELNEQDRDKLKKLKSEEKAPILPYHFLEHLLARMN